MYALTSFFLRSVIAAAGSVPVSAVLEVDEILRVRLRRRAGKRSRLLGASCDDIEGVGPDSLDKVEARDPREDF